MRGSRATRQNPEIPAFRLRSSGDDESSVWRISKSRWVWGYMIHVSGNVLRYGPHRYPCAVGKGGLIAAAEKREGDGCTPIGSFRLRECWIRKDRISPDVQTQLPLRIITAADQWCDDPAHPLYNKHFTAGEIAHLPAMQSFEQLWREDHVYDVIIPLGYNDSPIIPGKGSAIFLHIAKPDYALTEGCIAISLVHMLELLPQLHSGTTLVTARK